MLQTADYADSDNNIPFAAHPVWRFGAGKTQTGKASTEHKPPPVRRLGLFYAVTAMRNNRR